MKKRALTAFLLAFSLTGASVALANADISYLIQRAQQGDADAQNSLAYAYSNGLGVEQDDAQAAALLQQAAAQGIASAQNNLGVLYQTGRGVEQDLNRAEYWYARAAEQGLDAAQGNLDIVRAHNRRNAAPEDAYMPAERNFYRQDTAAVIYSRPQPENFLTAEHQSAPPPISLATFSGMDVGIDLSQYKYHEVVLDEPFMTTYGVKGGANVSVTSLFSGNVFLRGEGRFAYGPVDYYASDGSSINNTPDYMWEVRALVGKDFFYSDFSLSPYTGFGARVLYNDLGTSGGYLRQSRYQYIPVGITHRSHMLAQKSRLSATLEYDHFIAGTQRSNLADIGGPYENVTNVQDLGFGARGSLMLETPGWSIGPWFNYWHIADSDTVCAGAFCGMEPNNVTTEYGVKLTRKLF